MLSSNLENINRYIGFDSVTPEGSVKGTNLVAQLINTPELSEGFAGSGLYLNGIDQSADLGNHQDSCLGNVSLCNQGFSFAFWMKFGSKADDVVCQFVFATGHNILADTYNVCKTQNKLRVVVNTDDARYISLKYEIQSHVWYHVGVTWEALIGLTVMGNGVVIHQANGVSGNFEQTEETPLTLGKRPTSSNSLLFAEVTIDELYFWKTWMTNLNMWKVYMASGLAQG